MKQNVTLAGMETESSQGRCSTRSALLIILALRWS
jgi:hypothetical protein